ncbi:hypothetical protein NL676_030468 [Syzygium grande]|nr:hypothetical protein NL676_030468 [Syzygium grande]
MVIVIQTVKNPNRNMVWFGSGLRWEWRSRSEGLVLVEFVVVGVEGGEGGLEAHEVVDGGVYGVELVKEVVDD